MKKTNKYTFFLGNESCFSQWTKYKFQDNQKINYTSAEQYMMAQKALLFDDREIYNKIMNISNCKKNKRIRETNKKLQ